MSGGDMNIDYQREHFEAFFKEHNVNQNSLEREGKMCNCSVLLHSSHSAPKSNHLHIANP